MFYGAPKMHYYGLVSWRTSRIILKFKLYAWVCLLNLIQQKNWTEENHHFKFGFASTMSWNGETQVWLRGVHLLYGMILEQKLRKRFYISTGSETLCYLVTAVAVSNSFFENLKNLKIIQIWKLFKFENLKKTCLRTLWILVFKNSVVKIKK